MRAELTLIASLVAELASTAIVHASPLAPIRYDDCGASGRQPHVAGGGAWTFAESDVAGPLEVRTVAFAAPVLTMRYTGLQADAAYALRITYVTEASNPRVQSLTAGDVEVHGPLELPRGEAKTFEFPVPPQAIVNHTLALQFRCVSGHNAEVSEVWLLSDRVHPVLQLSARSDQAGVLKVIVHDGLLEPVPGADIRLVSRDVSLTGTTGPDGAASFDVTGEALGDDFTIQAQLGGVVAARSIATDQVIVRRPVLTPIPTEVGGVLAPGVSLGGTWRFSPVADDNWASPDLDDSSWRTIEVPGEWVMQGFTVEPNKRAVYRRTFVVPSDWRGRCAKLRFDAVYSVAEVRVNDTLVGRHQGGFTPFEADITDAVRWGEPNTLAVAVTNESMADTLASASGYARHQLGGITRKVTLFAVPGSHVSRFQASTDLDADYRDATLLVSATIAHPEASMRLRVALTDPSGAAVRLREAEARVPHDGSAELRIAVRNPLKWEAEHPNLYTLTGELVRAGRVVERVARRVGFREVEVRGPELLVNGHPVKLHGTCRHELSRDRGRSLTPDVWRRDVELLKGANINYVRTSHYPPAEEFLDLCDEVGIFVQDEAPWCWVNQDAANSPDTRGLLMRSTLEMVERDRSHPCVIVWDIANESAWGGNFAAIHERLRTEDPKRPTLFSGGDDLGACEIASWHYPGPGGPARVAGSTRPVTFDEYCHLNCYNPAEVAYDPGLRDYWGRAIAPMYDAMYAARECLGGSIWCWADDVFDLPGGPNGYGEWGIVDGWQRPKPEWWHVKKAYSPVKLDEVPVARTSHGTMLLSVENRYAFTDLSELECRWEYGGRSGTARTSAAPGKWGLLELPAPEPGRAVSVAFHDASGRLVDEYSVPGIRLGAPVTPRPATPRLNDTASAFLVSGDSFELSIEKSTGDVSAWAAGAEVLRAGPRLAGGRLGDGVDAFADDAQAAEVSAGAEDDHVRVDIARATEAGPATYVLEVRGDGVVSASYRLDYTGPEVEVRDLGFVWTLPRECGRLSWERAGQWSAYPPDHIGRLAGVAYPRLPGTDASPRPTLWSEGYGPGGCNDFRSTKYSILRAALDRPDGHGLEVLSDGSAHIRAFADGGSVTLRTLTFAMGGGEGFLRGHYESEVRTVKPGDTLSGSVVVRVR